MLARSSMMQSRTMLSRTVTPGPMLANGPTMECSITASSATNDGDDDHRSTRAGTSAILPLQQIAIGAKQGLRVAAVLPLRDRQWNHLSAGVDHEWIASAMKYSFLRERPRRICSSIAA